MDEPSKGLIIEGETVKKTGMSDDFWSTSTYDLDNSALQSQRSLSSLSISNQSLTGSTSNNSEFVNHGKSNFLGFLAIINKPIVKTYAFL